jgi:two-component system, chemotaxis family, CheB/CheR fusion protein
LLTEVYTSSLVDVWLMLRDVESGGERNRAGAFLDIGERKRTEEQFRQTQKLESIGLLAGGIAHDFNNLLTGIMGNASLALEEAGEDIADRLQTIISNGERAAHLTRQLLAYSGKGQFIVEDLDLSRAVREMVDLFRLSIPKSIELRLDLRERLPWVAMDPGQLQQVVMNLVINAGEAIGEGNPGRISVSTEVCNVERGFVDALGEDVAPGRYVCLEVTDTGPGVDDRMKSKIFDPFFTTKFTGRGLGLAAVSGIVRSQKGALVLRSAAGQRTAFRVFFRVAQTRRKQGEQESQDSTRVTILVVDDEESVRKFISAVLQRHGFRVLEANDGSEALAVCEKERQSLRIVILDLIMPVMSGSEFLAHIKHDRPDLKVLLTSGYGEPEARRLCAAYEGAAFIQKPYTAQQLEEIVENLLQSAG